MTRCRALWAVLLVGFLAATGRADALQIVPLNPDAAVAGMDAGDAKAGEAKAGPLNANSLKPNSTPAMWKLETGGATVYFLGSFHILPPSVTWRQDPRIVKALSESQALLVESDLADLETPEGAAMLLKYSILPDGKTLKDILSPETYRQFQKAAIGFGMDPAPMEHMKPWLAAAGLLVGYMGAKGSGPEGGVDDRLMIDARAMGKQILPLEGVEAQFMVLDTLSSQDPDLLVTDMIRFVDESTGQLAAVLTAWQTGDTASIDRILRTDLDRHEGTYDRFITNRNAAWVPKIEARIKDGGTWFVVVGAGHLVGDKSVIAMLQAKGYRVKRY